MGQLCLHGKWNAGTITWTRSAPLEEDPGEAAELMALYEQGNVLAQGGDLPRALALYQRGLNAFLELETPTAQHSMAEAALLWGAGTVLDRAKQSDEGYRLLLKIMSPGRQRDQLPLGLALNWTHSAVISGFRHDQYQEVAALLDGLQRLGWGNALRGMDEVAHAVRERYDMLFPFRARSFERLMQGNRFDEAAKLAEQAIRTLRERDPDEERRLSFWTMLLELAQRQTPDFRLADMEEEGVVEETDDNDRVLPTVSVRWSGTRLEWRVGEPAEDPNISSLARLYQAAAVANDQGDLSAALKGYQEGLSAWAKLVQPRPADAVVRAMMLWGKGCLEDRLSDADPESFPPGLAWKTLSSLADAGVGTALPLPVLLRWLQSSVIVATRLELWDEVQALLVFLMEAALHPQLGAQDEEIHSELTSRFLYLLEGAYAGIEQDAEKAADWVTALQRKIEPEGLVLLPLRDLLFHALTNAGRHRRAEVVANEVLAWARQEGDAETVQEWEEKAQDAKKAIS